ncbi:hypothetical protein [Lysobacter soyae]|jgi:hypothetical protein|uniref:Uncharacterized protein n=1 Tax=Lysobacter soyae TaxID=2764185 RepID=A0ABX8WLU7_9GAMM|nr:hypothetical protein [Lysobacter sp. CJ11]QYR52408.1 hypothetical protein H8L67_07320 [Lysobacter sp. CJ11]
MSWVAIAVLVLMLWLAMKTISFAIKLALWIGMAAVAYWLFAQAFGLPLP